MRLMYKQIIRFKYKKFLRQNELKSECNEGKQTNLIDFLSQGVLGRGQKIAKKYFNIFL